MRKSKSPPKNVDLGVKAKSSRLSGKNVAVAVSGGIGAVEVVKIIRELRRHGAKVTSFMTPSAGRFIGEDALSWASNRAVVKEGSYEVEYLEPFDILVVAPITLNTLSKASLGITDNVVGLLIASHLGAKRPALFVPAMNATMKAHPVYADYCKRLISWGVDFLESEEEEDRMKMPSPEAVLKRVLELA
jgi:phosphopantothenoylcysteine decarboxylase/phosphopantothenate--cysteine ligase